MGAYALFRLPYADCYTELRQNDGDAEELRSPAELCGRSGFAVAPFAVGADCPVLLLRPDSVETRPVERMPQPQEAEADALATSVTRDDRAAYARCFGACHERLVSGEFQKIVLARTAVEEAVEAVNPRRLFERACRLYPRMFVALVCAPRCGTWLTATPETLLEGQGAEWRTMALAGTMRLSDEQQGLDTPPQCGTRIGDMAWSQKDRDEQRLVAVYIKELLARLADRFSEDGPYTVRAGNLVHLRSDFGFTLSDPARLGELLTALHPTPAVCGLPKEAAFRFIVEHEPTPRRYYSGFMGPLDLGGATHLYVALRCMEIVGDRRCRLYAGGGLLDSSTEEREWRETEAKMETMRLCLQTKRTSTF